jgi:release factor glutamine methyltransferase
MTVGQALDVARRRLEEAGVERWDADWLLCALLGIDRGRLVARRSEPLDAGTAERFDAWIARRLRHEPAQYIRGEQEFHGLAFTVDARALVPRPETEGLVDAVLGFGLPAGARVADFGTGSGAIAIAIAVRRPDLFVFGLDRSPAALSLAAENVARHGVADRVLLRQGSFADPPSDWRALDAIVSNPPYVRGEDWERLEPEITRYEPIEALVPGETGYEAYRELVPAARRWLAPGGRLALEIGHGQATEVRQIAAVCGFEAIEIGRDLRGIERVVTARNPREE